MKIVQCLCCAWKLGITSMRDAYDDGWRLRARFMKPGPNQALSIELRFLCGTCASSIHSINVCDPGCCPEEEKLFAQMPEAPPDAFPAVGGIGERHRDRVKPFCGRCGGGDPSQDDIVHEDPGVLQ